MLRRLSVSLLIAASLLLTASAAWAQPASAPAPNAAMAAPQGPAPYEAFAKGATVQAGLFPILTKLGITFLEIQKSQLGADFIETSVPASGLGGFGPAPGEPYVAPARIIHFERYGNTIVLRWPNEFALAVPNSPQAEGTSQSLPGSVIAVVPIVAQDDTRVVIPAAPFLGDVADLADSLKDAAGGPAHAYHLDPTKSFFAAAKAFPKNDVLRVDQTWVSLDPDKLDNAPDPRSVEVKMTYNLIAAPNDGYVPRIADQRVGFFSQPLLNFASDSELRRDVHYVARWNFGPRTSSAPVTAANPIVFYLSNDIPVEYRDTVTKALLTWNAAFAKIGILNAIKVEQQPNDPSWDPEDITHNMIRWIDTSSPQYGAEALLVTDPRTGEELNVGVNFDAIEGIGGRLLYKYEVAPARGLADSRASEKAFADSFIRSVILHESGHDLGLQHNFIGSMAYTAQQEQSQAFTQKYGIASSVMEYNPINLWPKGTAQGEYNQLVLGPYDYYAIRYGYGYIPNATTPESERATLQRWASRWSDPKYRFASDEDAGGLPSGHGIDPRVVTYDLTNKPLAWCATQMTMLHGLMDSVNARFPERGMPYDEARSAFLTPLRQYLRCAVLPANTIGGEYLSRAQRGDPGAPAVPLAPVSVGDQRDAWQRLSRGLFADAAWHFNPTVLRTLTYSEVSSLSQDGSWAYSPTPRHDVSVAGIAESAQAAALSELFAPLRLQRIDDLASKYGPGQTIDMTQLFDWSRASIFGNIADGSVAKEGLVRRNLQMMFARYLANMVVMPIKGTPDDAQALARVSLEDLRHDAATALNRGNLDELTRGHLAALEAIANQALTATRVSL
ncbi:MAG TPA: zinc-dependent metalloprotease [Candidatus Baltobacteraceae bacterium]|nr:zinc-dependent metalloprotease [Candidatus Baltobacteraceae bacterium]